MSERTAIDQIGLELHEMAKAYALKADAPASDPYFRDAVLKVSVSGFVWALYEAFDDPMARAALLDELNNQHAAVAREVNHGADVTNA